jgi:hypothetical protein
LAFCAEALVGQSAHRCCGAIQRYHNSFHSVRMSSVQPVATGHKSRWLGQKADGWANICSAPPTVGQCGNPPLICTQHLLVGMTPSHQAERARRFVECSTAEQARKKCWLTGTRVTSPHSLSPHLTLICNLTSPHLTSHFVTTPYSV